MGMIKVTLPDQTVAEYAAGVTMGRILLDWKAPLASSAVAGKVNQVLVDMSYPLTETAAVAFVDVSSREGLNVLRHSISHVMAQAVQESFAGAKVSIGPSIEDGFYYDFEYGETFTPDDLEKIEKRMRRIIEADYPFTRQELSRDEAVALFEEKGEPYKVELIRDLPSDVERVSLYRQGDYVDLCRGPHIPSTGMIKAFKLLNVAGAYWRGDERNKMLQRIYGTGFATQEDLADYLRIM
ncbi:MAG TPA: threonine--tRNA ligase, partial [Syntrophales bacterium]|nr:threonine--tRNA ligase [Syntrophales bacterium]